MSRWKYKTAVVTIGENTATVRQLTAGEQRLFAAASKKNLKADDAEKVDQAVMLVKFGTTEPPLSDEDAAAMPPDFMAACVDKILELSDLKEAKAPNGTGTVEKKEPASSELNS